MTNSSQEFSCSYYQTSQKTTPVPVQVQIYGDWDALHSSMKKISAEKVIQKVHPSVAQVS